MNRCSSKHVWMLALVAAFAVGQIGLAQQGRDPSLSAARGPTTGIHQQADQGTNQDTLQKAREKLEEAKELSQKSKELAEEAKQKAREAKQLAQQAEQDGSAQRHTAPAQTMRRDRPARSRDSAQRAAGQVHRASEVVGLQVKSQGDEDLGELQDLRGQRAAPLYGLSEHASDTVERSGRGR